MVKRERHVVNGKVPQHLPLHFLWVSSQILVFAELFWNARLNRARKQSKLRWVHACEGVEVIPQGPPDHMANGRVEMAVREVNRQCRTLRISAENTSVRIADDSPLLSWLPRFAAQVMNKMRIGKDGKTSEMRRTGRGWRKPMAQFGEKVWFSKIGDRPARDSAQHRFRGWRCPGSHHRRHASRRLCARRRDVFLPLPCRNVVISVPGLLNSIAVVLFYLWKFMHEMRQKRQRCATLWSNTYSPGVSASEMLTPHSYKWHFGGALRVMIFASF